MEKLIQKLNVANKSTHRLLLKQRRGMKQAQMKTEGKQLKRERVSFSPLLNTPLEDLISNEQLYNFDDAKSYSSLFFNV